MFRVIARILFVFLVLVGLASLPLSAQDNPKDQQNQPKDQKASGQPASAQAAADTPQDEAPDPLKRTLDPKKKKQQMKAFKREVSPTYRKWLDEDVIYIITPEERAAFKQLSNDE